MSVRWRHCIDHADTKQKPLMRPDCLLGVVPQPTDSRLSETNSREDLTEKGHFGSSILNFETVAPLAEECAV